jgi:hypothetical protein
MNTISTLLKVSLKFGAIAGVLGSVFLIILYYIGKHPLLFALYFDFRIILFAIFIFFTLKEYRDFHHQGVLYFWEGIIGCFVFVTTYALISSTAIYFFGKIEVNFVPSFVNLFTQQVKKDPTEIISQIGEKNFQLYLNQLSTIDSFQLAQNYFKQSFIISFFLSIILSVILRRHPKP